MRALLPLLLLVAALLAPPRASAAAPQGPGWLALPAGPVALHHRARDAGIAAALAEQVPSVLARIEERTGTRAPARIDVVLVGGFEEFAALQPGQPPSWAAGTAYPPRAEVYLRTRLPHVGADPIDRVFVHELVHVLVGQRFGERDLPRWLDEGTARLFAGELAPKDHVTLARAALGGGLLPLAELTTRWPASPGRAELAYAQSVDFVAFLAEERPGALPRLIAALADGAELNAALVAATGSDLATLERAWRGDITFWHALLPVIGGSGVTWGFGAIVFVAAGWRRRRAFHRQVAAMARAEAARAEALRAEERRQASLWPLWVDAATEAPEPHVSTIVYVDGPARSAPRAGVDDDDA